MRCAFAEPMTLFHDGQVQERAAASVLYFISVYFSLHVLTLQIQSNYSFPFEVHAQPLDVCDGHAPHADIYSIGGLDHSFIWRRLWLTQRLLVNLHPLADWKYLQDHKPVSTCARTDFGQQERSWKTPLHKFTGINGINGSSFETVICKRHESFFSPKKKNSFDSKCHFKAPPERGSRRRKYHHAAGLKTSGNKDDFPKQLHQIKEVVFSWQLLK